MNTACRFAWLLLAPLCAAAGEAPVSPAETRLFVEHHLSNVQAPTTLRYALVRSGSLEPSKRDELELSLGRASGGGCCAVAARYVAQQQGGMPALPQIDDARSNPVVLYFLEHDVRDMQRLTGGQANYFRKRIRQALADDATLADTRVRYRGQQVSAVEVRVTPYAGDPMRARYERFAGKQYVFVLADGVPGRVLQVRTLVPGATADATPLLQETLTLEDDK
jgi:hypothetical protein